MNGWRLLLAIICPPLAVLDRGCGTTVLVAVLTLAGYFPGLIAALLIVLADSPRPGAVDGAVSGTDRRFVEIPTLNQANPKRKGAFVHLADGDMLEVIEDDDTPPNRKRGDS